MVILSVTRLTLCAKVVDMSKELTGIHMKQNILSRCPICEESIHFDFVKDYEGCREIWSRECPFKSFSGCVTRERGLGQVAFQLFNRDELKKLVIFECSPCMRGFSLWLNDNCNAYYCTGYYPDKPFGSIINGLRNENLEDLSLDDSTIDVWIHLDVLEHLYNPFQAMREIFRTLKPGGYCLFSAPTYPDRAQSEQVAWVALDGTVKTKGDPEYHGNPQNSVLGSLVTWRYGYDLPLLIQRETGFDVEVRRWQSREIAVMGKMTEVYICKKPKAE